MIQAPDFSEDAIWRKRFETPVVAWSNIASQNPSRGIVCTNKDGIYQLYAWDVVKNKLRKITDHPTGVVQGTIAADGESIYYLHDSGGNELGHYVRVPLDGGDPMDITPDMPEYASWHLTESYDGSRIGFSAANAEWGFRVYVTDQRNKILFTYENSVMSVGPDLSYDGRIAVIANTEKSDNVEFALEAYDVDSGAKLGELWDGEQSSISPVGFATRAGDERYLAETNKSGFARPLLWNPRTGERVDIPLPQLEGDVAPLDWSEDGRYLLLRQLQQAHYQLYLYDLDTATLTRLDHPSGTYSSAYFVGDHIFTNMESSVSPGQVVELDKTTGEMKRIVLAAGTPPASHRFESVRYFSGDGTPIQAWLAKPEGTAPFPAIVHIHGGPTDVMTDVFSPEIQAWVDHGFAVLSVNYRGSTTFGRDFEHAIDGNLGDLEVEDVVAGARWLLENGLADADGLLITGASYGGYLTLQTIGKKSGLFAAGIAVVAIADWVLMYEDQAETLRSYQRGLFGGTPQQRPEAHRKASPSTYAAQVESELLVIQGRNDTRCPARQMEFYLRKLDELGKAAEVHWFDAGHGSRETKQAAEHMEIKLRFAYRVIG